MLCIDGSFDLSCEDIVHDELQKVKKNIKEFGNWDLEEKSCIAIDKFWIPGLLPFQNPAGCEKDSEKGRNINP